MDKISKEVEKVIANQEKTWYNKIFNINIKFVTIINLHLLVAFIAIRFQIVFSNLLFEFIEGLFRLQTVLDDF
jgi:hypothetical protein